ncbi:DUF6090 family protein [Aequorivita sp. CIP111184]|uniref:DUF6090 family protein n=1 Tax=Aequorivita sp. CIP111184 TaxID=2211356 RepID=UPI000DBBF60E|nr:DUF6090 family protein [Aequorivita sp. CIP111184]SRX54421.1 hypothetical protein AEQU1_01431 [Aequorivita sp. CIP111184]
MKTGKTGKYLKYVIGEIILVVIGILIALSINNWNENRKQEKQILKALSEVRNNLIGDSLAISNTLKLKLEDIEIQNRVIQLLNNDRPLDSTINKDLGRIMIARKIKLIPNGYSLLKHIGLERIEDLNLRNKLIEYYEISINLIETDTNDDLFEFVNTFLPYVRSHFSDWQYEAYGIPLDYVKLKNDDYFKTSLKVNIGNEESTVIMLTDGLKNIKTLLPLINIYIRSND